MKNFFFILLFSTLIFCSFANNFQKNKDQRIYQCEDKNKPLLDSMKYIYALPDDYFFSPKGDSICEKIINKGNNIVSCLIDRITDHTKTKVRIADKYDYEVGDIAAFLLSYIYSFEKKSIPLRKMIIAEFYNNEDDGDFFETIYNITFFSHSKKINRLNKVKLQKQIKDWYFNNPQYPILDSLQYIAYLPDENYSSFGDSISERIIKMGDIIVPKLVEKIPDTTKTKMKIADIYDVTVSDVAITLIQYIYLHQYGKTPPIRDLLIQEFYNNIDDGDFEYSLYYKTFYSNSSRKNYKNRIRFYEKIKKWYDEKKIQYNCFEKNQLILDSLS
jgi:hypothetical protein